MTLLQRFFSVGRLSRPPKDHTGRLAPASTQRTQLGLRSVDLPKGVIELRGGEVRALLRVTGVTLQHRSSDGQHAFLLRWAHALNAMPPDVSWLVRSRAGGLEGHIAGKQAQATALAQRQPGSGLAKLAADQLAHAQRLQARGDVRQTDNYVAVRHAGGDVAALLRLRDAATVLLREAGLRVEVLKDRALAQAIAESWNPNERGPMFLFDDGQTIAEHVEYWPGYPGMKGNAVVRPAPAPKAAAQRATVIERRREKVLAG